jgi:hypothetical protein
MSFYERHQEERKEYQREYLANLPADKKQKMKLYHQEYYLKRKASGKIKKYIRKPPKITTLPPAVIAPPPPSNLTPSGLTKQKGIGQGNRTPRQYMRYEKDYGLQYTSHYMEQKLLANAPLGFFQRPPDANPFLIKWD